MKKLRTLLTAGILALTSTISAIGAIPTSYAEDTETTANMIDYVDYDSTCYFSDANGTVFEFNKIYSIEEGYEFTFVDAETLFCKGVICRPYTGTEKPFYVMDCSKDLSQYDTEGTFTYEGNEYNYKLFPPAKMFPSLRRKILKMVVHILPVNEKEIARYDYNRDGNIDIRDSILFNQRISATPFIHVTNLSTDEYEFQQMSQADFLKILDYKYQNGEEEIKICFGDEVPAESPQAKITNIVGMKDDTEETTVAETTNAAKEEITIAEATIEVKEETTTETSAEISPATTETSNPNVISVITKIAIDTQNICNFITA